MTSMFYGLDVMDCNVKPSLAGGFQSPQGAPQGEITKGTFVKGHLCAYLSLVVRVSGAPLRKKVAPI